MSDTLLVPPMGDPNIGLKLNQFVQSVLDDQNLLEELAEFIWKSKERYGRGFYIRKFGFLPSHKYFDEVKAHGQMIGFYVDSSLIPKSGERFKTQFDHLLNAYDPQKEFVIAVIAMVEQQIYFSSVAIAYPEELLKKWASQKAKLSRGQIKKRLRRMVQAGRRLLILDTQVPEIKENLEVWLDEAKKLSINVIIHSTDEQESQLPERWQNEVLTLKCK